MITQTLFDLPYVQLLQMLEANSVPLQLRDNTNNNCILAVIEMADYKGLVTDLLMELFTWDTNIASPKHNYYKIKIFKALTVYNINQLSV